MKPNAEIIKTAVMSYYRFKRQMLCTDEASCYVAGETSDVLVDSGKFFYDVEIKVDKYDLWKGEARKIKHNHYRRCTDKEYSKTPGFPNYFIMCVPTSLIDEAQKWIEETNQRYGLIEFREESWKRMWESGRFWRIEELVWVRRSPKRLHEHRSSRLSDFLIRRLCSAYINKRQQELIRYWEKENSSNERKTN